MVILLSRLLSDQMPGIPATNPPTERNIDILSTNIFSIKFMLTDDVGVIAYDWFNCPKKQYKRKVLLAVNPYENTGAMRVLSRKKYLELHKHYKKTIRNYKRNHKKVEEEFRKKKDEYTSYEFWLNYLGIK